jgi:hypothetical protein
MAMVQKVKWTNESVILKKTLLQKPKFSGTKAAVFTTHIKPSKTWQAME